MTGGITVTSSEHGISSASRGTLKILRGWKLAYKDFNPPGRIKRWKRDITHYRWERGCKICVRK